MIIRETLIKTIRCPKTSKACVVQDVIHGTVEKQGSPESVIHEYSCRDFSQCPKCAKCQYHSQSN
jgi:hypothetical protein